MKRMVSIQPQYVSLIKRGLKTLELRKNPFNEGDEVFIYCCKGKMVLLEVLHKGDEVYGEEYKEANPSFIKTFSNDQFPFIFNGLGQVVAKFIVGRCEKITYDVLNRPSGDYSVFYTKSFDILELHRKSCVKVDFLREYYSKGREGCFAIEITNLQFFDHPKFLQEFGLKKAPQSWCYVKEGV